MIFKGIGFDVLLTSKYNRKFEKEFEKVGSKFAIMVNSGSSAGLLRFCKL